MKVQILEKIYHSSENPVNARLHRRLRELHWINSIQANLFLPLKGPGGSLGTPL